MSDDLLLRKALSMLQSFADNLPRGSISETYVNVYHGLLADISRETAHQLDYFLIGPNDLKKEIVSTYFGELGTGPAQNTYSKERFCDRPMFLIKLNGVLNYLRSFLPEPQQRIIGFSKP